MADDNDNGRVTLALVGQKLDTLIDKQREYNDTQIALMKIASQNKQDIAVMKSQASDMAQDLKDLSEATNKAIDSLNNKFSIFSGGNSLLALIATALAVIFGVRQP